MIFDFDNTLVYTDGTTSDLEILKEMKNTGIELCLATRNDLYEIQDKLPDYNLDSIFTYIMADFRPKNYQIKHILYNYSKNRRNFDLVLFIDDHYPNIELVKSTLPNITCLWYGKDINHLSGLLDIISES